MMKFLIIFALLLNMTNRGVIMKKVVQRNFHYSQNFI